ALVRMAGYAERAGRRSGWFHPARQWSRSCGSPAWTGGSWSPRPAGRLSPEDTPGRPPRPTGGSVGTRRAIGRATVTTRQWNRIGDGRVRAPRLPAIGRRAPAG